jgi:hypothetical protein
MEARENQADMAVTFAVWDDETGNLVAAYDTEAAALAVLREALQVHGRSYLESLSLVREGPRGGLRVIAHGPRLVEHLTHAVPPATGAAGVQSAVRPRTAKRPA